MKKSILIVGLLLKQAWSQTTIEYEYGRNQNGLLYNAILPARWSEDTHREYQAPFDLCSSNELYARMTVNDHLFHQTDIHQNSMSSFQDGFSSFRDGFSSFQDGFSSFQDGFSSFQDRHSAFNDYGIQESAFYDPLFDSSLSLNSDPRRYQFPLERLPTRITISADRVIEIQDLINNHFDSIESKVVQYFSLCLLSSGQLPLSVQAASCERLKHVLLKGELEYDANSPGASLEMVGECPARTVILHDRFFTLRVLQKTTDTIKKFKDVEKNRKKSVHPITQSM